MPLMAVFQDQLCANSADRACESDRGDSKRVLKRVLYAHSVHCVLSVLKILCLSCDTQKPPILQVVLRQRLNFYFESPPVGIYSALIDRETGDLKSHLESILGEYILALKCIRVTPCLRTHVSHMSGLCTIATHPAM